MTGRAVLVLVLTAGCTDDPSVSVRFEVPDGYRDLVEAVSLEVLASEELDCDAVALGNASEEEQAAARVAEALVRDAGGSAPLSGIPRTGKKLFVARALSTSGQLVAAGCAEAGTIDGDQDLVIAGEPALTLGARDTPSGGSLPDQLTALVSDARGQPVEGVVAQQTVYAAHETALPGPAATSGPGGVLRFEVNRADWAGPQVLDVDLRWQANERDLFSGFEIPFLRDSAGAAAADDLPLRFAVQVGRLGYRGDEIGVAVLGRADVDGLRPIYLFGYDGGVFRTPIATEGIPATAIGLVETGDGERIVAMDATTWYTVAPDGSIDRAQRSQLFDAVAMAPLSACAAGAPRDRVLAVSGSGEVGLFDPSGLRVDQEWTGARPDGVGELLAAGCVRGVDQRYRAAVYAVAGDAGSRPMLAIDAPDSEPTPVNSQVDRGFAFTPDVAGGEGPFLLANRFENDGNSIARYTAVPVGGAPTFLDEASEDEIAGVATSTAGGDFDGDGRLDVAAMVTLPNGDGGLDVRFFMALGFEVEGERLFGLGATGIDSPELRPLLLAYDFDQDGYDDLLLATTIGFSLFELEPE